MKTWIVIVLLVLLGIAAWFAYGYFTPGIPVEAATVRRGDVHEFVDELGKTRLPKSHLITMPFQGRIEAIGLAEGASVTQGQVVARISPLDLQLSLDAAQAAVARTDASILENDDTSVEETALKQSNSFVESMEHAVDAAAARVQSGQAKRDYAEGHLARVLRLRESNTASQEALDLAQVQYVESNVDYQQDVLVHSALVAMKAATDLMPTMVQQYIDRKDLSRAVLEKERAQAEYKLREAQRDQQRGTLTSPVEGVVLERQVSDERYLAAGTVLLEIGRLEDLEVEADVLSQDVVKVTRGKRVEIYGPAIGPQPARGTVHRIYPAGFTKVSSLGVEQQRVKVIVRFDPQDASRMRQSKLGVGYRVGVKIFTASRKDTLVIPRSALFRGAASAWQVFAVHDGRARLQEVEVGLMNDELAEVRSGLNENDVVILAPETNLADSERVEPILRGRP